MNLLPPVEKQEVFFASPLASLRKGGEYDSLYWLI
jgi:hypothetical protein